jgi:hypothetical protein
MSEQTSQPETQLVETEPEYVAPFPVATRENKLAEGEVPSSAGRAAATVMVRGDGNATAMALTAMATVELQMKMAMSFPRSRDRITVDLAMACQNPEFAEVALYTYPQGKTTISGPSIKLAEEMARHWGNLNSGYYIVMDAEDQRTVRAWAWDMEKNVRRESDVTFAKLIQRNFGGRTDWIVPDERGLQQLTAAKAATGVRNMILSLMPDQLKRDAVSWCRQTMKTKDAKDPDAFRKRMMLKFANLGINLQTLTDLIGKDVGTLRSPADEATIEYLRGVFNRIDRGEASMHEILAERAQQLGIEGPTPQTAEELRRMVNEKTRTRTTKR